MNGRAYALKCWQICGQMYRQIGLKMCGQEHRPMHARMASAGLAPMRHALRNSVSALMLTIVAGAASAGVSI